MTSFTRAVKATSHHVTDTECDAIIERFRFDDDRSNHITALEAFLGQFHAHWYVNSKGKGDTLHNLYNFDADGSFGAYPTADKGSILIDKATGKYHYDEYGLPTISTEIAGDIGEVAPDAHRGTENKTLTAMHLLLAKLHNSRIDDHGDYDLAKQETVACFNHAFLHATMKICGIESQAEFLNVKIKDFHRSLEYAFSVGRFGHAQMPATINGQPLFGFEGGSAKVDMVTLSTTEMAGKLGMRIAIPMHEGSEGGKGVSILKHTVEKRHNQLGLASFQELANRMRIHSVIDIPNCPIWVGVLREAELHNESTDNDTLGPVGARAVADGMAGTLMWGQDRAQGLWHPRWNGAPSTIAEIVEHVW